MASNIDKFISEIRSIEIENCFNPYINFCEVYDIPGAPEIRSDNLQKILERCAKSRAVDIWIGRDLGHRGGRRTGVALIDEYHLDQYTFSLGLKKLTRSTQGVPVKEQTASCVALAMETCDVPILTWNAFPFHPHRPLEPFSNRMHSRDEAKVGVSFLQKIVNLVPIRNFVAVGADASTALGCSHPEHRTVRHPSYGGKALFLRHMRDLYPGERRSFEQLSFDTF